MISRESVVSFQDVAAINCSHLVHVDWSTQQLRADEIQHIRVAKFRQLTIILDTHLSGVVRMNPEAIHRVHLVGFRSIR